MLFLFLASIIPGLELTVLAISGLLVMIIINEVNIKGGLAFYVATGLLAFLIIPNKSIMLLYIFIFGPYSIIKSFIEKYFSNHKILEYILKILSFDILLAAGFMIFKEAFFAGINLPDFAWWMLLIGAQVMLILYDFILTYAVRFYERRVPESIRGKRLF